ncbi:MAG: bifunctional riboflavin kinase/FAD synthetase [Flavobacteriaceae bacterium]
MAEIKNITNYNAAAPTVVTIGTFDGVHIGHQKIIKRLVKTGQDDDLRSVVLTFFPHPRMVLQKDTNIKLINTITERRTILEGLGLDFLLVKTFTKAFSRLSAEDFVKQVLVDTLNAKKIIIGYDHRFGRNRNANINDLKHYGNLYGFTVEEIPAQDIDEVAVSSTKIREALSQGEIEKANAYLGYCFMLSGTVVKGKSLGKKIGFPTANIEIRENYKLIPKHGAYVVRATINGAWVYGMMNIGTNPTVNGKTETVEVHFFNFNNDIYNKSITVEVLHRLRDEQKFSSVEALKTQLQSDKETALSYIKQQGFQ